MDNYESYDISLSLQLPKGEIYIVTKENYNSVIKDIFILFHNAQAAGINRPSVKCTV